LTDTTLHLTIVVKGDWQEARKATNLHLNDWFHQDIVTLLDEATGADIGPAPYPVGSLLHWGYDLAQSVKVGPALEKETASKIDAMIRGR
jgi:hypothetical protein